jgi:hypothetical protein
MNWWRYDPRLRTPEPAPPAIKHTSHADSAISNQESRHGS